MDELDTLKKERNRKNRKPKRIREYTASRGAESDESDPLKGFDKLNYHKLFIRVYSLLKKGSKVLRLIIQAISNLQELQFLKKQNLIKPKISEKK